MSKNWISHDSLQWPHLCRAWRHLAQQKFALAFRLFDQFYHWTGMFLWPFTKHQQSLDSWSLLEPPRWSDPGICLHFYDFHNFLTRCDKKPSMFRTREIGIDYYRAPKLMLPCSTCELQEQFQRSWLVHEVHSRVLPILKFCWIHWLQWIYLGCVWDKMKIR